MRFKEVMRSFWFWEVVAWSLVIFVCSCMLIREIFEGIRHHEEMTGVVRKRQGEAAVAPSSSATSVRHTGNYAR